MSKIIIDMHYHNDPHRPYWMNMFNYLESMGYINYYGDISPQSIRKEMKKVGAKYYAGTYTLVFPDEQSYTAWLLKWSN